jgi:DNA-binding transcriptional MerR regulator
VEKAPDAFRTISEVAQELDVPQHVLRFWESRFREIRPMKRGGGRRYYRPDDVGLLRGIRHLLYGEGYTIRGVQRLLREQGVRFVQNVWQPGAPQPNHRPSEDAADEADDAAAERYARARDGEDGEEGADDEAPAARRAAAPAPAGLAAEDVRKLEGALRELGECRRLLDAVLDKQA